MAWTDKRKNFRLRDRIGGKNVTVVRNLGVWKGAADNWLVEYKKALSQGFTFTPPITVAHIENFLKAKKEGLDSPDMARRIPIEEMVDLYIKHQGPSVKGGIQLGRGSSRTPYYNFCCRMNQIKKVWAGKWSDEITKLDVRDYLARYTSVGTHMKILGTAGHLFRSLYDWNEEGNILPFKVRLPQHNPVSKWRKEMKPAQKRELPDTRVLSPEEWAQFRPHLKVRTRAICEIALKRFLRMADIKTISQLKIVHGQIRGLQEKTGEAFSVPVLADQPTGYDFTNFKREFLAAQVAAKMNWPPNHPLHFSVKDLRRTGATWAYNETKDLVGISEMLGHRNIKTTIRYLNITHADKARIAKAVDKIADKLWGPKPNGGAPVEQKVGRHKKLSI